MSDYGGRRDKADNWGKGQADTALYLLKSKGPTRRRKRRPKGPLESTRQRMAAEYRESRGIVLVSVGQS